MEHIGQKIKELRLKNDLTQDRLADYLGVSAQAVSKWECGISMPDLTLIAPLTRVLGCTADELLGLDGEDEKGADNLIDELKNLPPDEDRIQRIKEMIQIAATKYPRNERLSLAIAQAERVATEPFPYETENPSIRQDAEKRFQTILAQTADSGLRSDAAGGLAYLLLEDGRRAEAAEAAEQYNSATKDLLLLSCLDGDEWMDRQQFLVYKSLNSLCNTLEKRGRERDHLPSLEAAETVVRALLCDGNYVGYSNRLFWNADYQIRLLIGAGEYERAVKKLRDQVDYAAQYLKILRPRSAQETYIPYTAPALDSWGEGVEDWGRIDPSNGESYTVKHLRETWATSPVYAPLRDRDDFQALLAEYGAE